MRAWNIAHRGGAALRPENTPAAFGNAIGLECNGAELDVQLSADGIAVVYHDFRLNPGYTRLRGGDWAEGAMPRVKDLALEELYQYDLGTARPGSAYAKSHPYLKSANGVGIPTLEYVVGLSNILPAFRLFVELKCDLSEDSADPVALADAAYDVIAAVDFLDQAIFVGFDWRALARVRQRDPAASCWFTTDKLHGDARPVIDMVAATGGQGSFPHFGDVTPDSIAHARGLGLKVGAWTVNDPADMRRLMDLDAICTDRPDLLVAL
jgi:glycerophosphoryl diester phosphodiesterase